MARIYMTGDTTSIDVTGQISNPGSFNYVTLNQGIQNLPLADLPPDTANNWQTALTLAVDPNKIATQTIPAGIDSVTVCHLCGSRSSVRRIPPVQLRLRSDDTKAHIHRFHVFYPSRNALNQPLTVLVYGPNGYPVVDENPSDANYGHFETTTINWINPTTDPDAISTLYTESQGAPRWETPAAAMSLAAQASLTLKPVLSRLEILMAYSRWAMVNC